VRPSIITIRKQGITGETNSPYGTNTKTPHAGGRRNLSDVSDRPSSQPSSDISPIWTPVTTAEVKKHKTTPSPIEIKRKN
jgi:hypothetical protein